MDHNLLRAMPVSPEADLICSLLILIFFLSPFSVQLIRSFLFASTIFFVIARAEFFVCNL